jgi:hypothetical protein
MQQIASGFKFAEVTPMHPLNHQPGEDRDVPHSRAHP